MLKRTHPEAQIIGLDGDPQVLAIARDITRGADIQWDEGLASSLPYPDSTFDRVVTSLVIHRLVTDDKRRGFKEIYRVLKPHGELQVLDFGAPHSLLTRFMTTYMRRLEETADNFDGQIRTDQPRDDQKSTTLEWRVARVWSRARVRLKIVLGDSEKQDHQRGVGQVDGRRQCDNNELA